MMPGPSRDHIKDEHGRRVDVARTRLPAKAAPAGTPTPRALVTFRAKLDELASRVRRLAPPASHNPEKFHEERSEIAREIQRLAEQLKD